MNSTDFLLSLITNLPGIGSKIAPKIEKLVNGNQVIDLLFLRPTNIVKRRFIADHRAAAHKELIITLVTVESHEKPFRSGSPFKIRCSNDFGELTLIFFKTFPGYIEKNFPLNTKIAISGRIEFFNNESQMVHPDFVMPASMLDRIPANEVIYPLTLGINSKMLRSIIFKILNFMPDLGEWSDANLIKQNHWPTFKKALTNMHYPKDLSQLEDDDNNIKRLAFDELLASSLANLIAKKNSGEGKGRKNLALGELVEKIKITLPFILTDGQEKALAEIFSDLRSDKKMLRLLQGDVGSGKTILAFLAAILTKEDQKQTAIIVPISLLASQHFENLKKLVEGFGINIAILTSRTTKAAKNKILKELKDGKIDIIIGTHALIFPDIIFKDLGLIIIDEQHRFGVMQRMQLVEKGEAPDVLLMSATPIPRSLMLTLYGDMDISLLTEKPKNRLKIDTRVKSMAKIEEVLEGLKRALAKGEKIYWICPLIEEAEESDFSNVLTRYQLFLERFGEEKVALIHGKLKGKEKDEIMNNFSNPASPIQILIATTVIEVGIDVKDASIIIIENSERFGLSQLHQLRGRVGRSDKPSYCLLLFNENLGANGKKRLEIMRDCFDGFAVAEEDLKMRGSGEMFGTKQSGLPEYKFANLISHQDLLKIANKNAQIILTLDPNLSTMKGENVKNLLRIFKYDHFIKLTRGG